jgi:hypothetical protein
MPSLWDEYQAGLGGVATAPRKRSLWDAYQDDLGQEPEPERLDLNNLQPQETIHGAAPQQRSRTWSEWLNPPLPQANIVQPVEGGGQGVATSQQVVEHQVKKRQLAEQDLAEQERQRQLQLENMRRMQAARDKIQGVGEQGRVNPTVQKAQSLMDVAREVPGVKGNYEMVMDILASRAAARINEGQGTDEDFTLIAERERMQHKDAAAAGFVSGVYDMAVGSAPFITGMGLSAGIRGAAGQAAKRATGSAIASGAARVTAGTLNPAMIPMIARSSAGYTAPSVDEYGNVIQGDDLASAVGKGTASTAIEVASEGLGEVIAPALSKVMPVWAKRIADRMRGPGGSMREAFS